MRAGRPLWFLLAVLAGWTATRLAMVLPLPRSDDVPTPPPVVSKAALPRRASFAWMFPPSPPGHRDPPEAPRPSRPAAWTAPPVARSAVAKSAAALSLAQPALIPPPPPSSARARSEPVLADPVPSPHEAAWPGPPETPQSRWSGAAWIVGRRKGPADRPLLAGSQAGLRLDYALSDASPLRPALYGRLSGALEDPVAAEVAVGIAVRPHFALPLTIAVERRQAISPGGRKDFALVAAGGLNPTPVAAGLRLDGYAQAGIVGLKRRDAFVDGRLILERPLGQAIAIGAGLWGGAQPGTSRLDLGPQASLRLRLSDAALRIGVEWRERVAGNAAPASGPALSIGTDF